MKCLLSGNTATPLGLIYLSAIIPPDESGGYAQKTPLVLCICSRYTGHLD